MTPLPHGDGVPGLDALCQRMLADLALAGLAPGTQEGYVRSVRHLTAQYGLPPDCLTEQQVRDHFLHLKEGRGLAPGTLSVAFSGIKFFYTHTVPRDWKTLTMVRVPKPKTLPDVLTIAEVRRLIDAVRKPHLQAFFWTMYSLGLRLSEGLHLQVGDIDSQRMLVHIHLGKGAKDRYVPLPAPTLTRLRQHWRTHRHPLWLFPAPRSRRRSAEGVGPLERATVQNAMARVVEELGFRKAVSTHTLRHSYATHLLEAGVNLRLIQHYLGHSSLKTTMVYLHVTALGQERARALIEGVMAGEPMPSVADVLRQYGPAYLERYGAAMPPEHKKVLQAIMACRTGELGTALYVCQSCGKTHAIASACGDRHCPSCQWGKTAGWLEQETARLLPCPYFLVTFTVPAALRAVIRRHQRIGYAALFEASSAALKALASNPRFVGSPHCGFVGVLHTWGRTLEYHPHVHYIVPGGGLSEDGTEWLPARPNFFVPHRALAILFRAKFRDALDRAGLLDQVDPAVWRADWVVDSRAAGDGRTSLKYLAPYVFRVAISDHRIISCDDGRVTFSYRRVGSKRMRRMTVDAPEFLRRFLQHVLPAGFQKVRHYGFLSPTSRFAIETVRRLVASCYGLIALVLAKASPLAVIEPGLRCDACGGPLLCLGRLSPAEVPCFDTS